MKNFPFFSFLFTEFCFFIIILAYCFLKMHYYEKKLQSKRSIKKGKKKND